MSKPSAHDGPTRPHPSSTDGSTSETRAVAVTLTVLAVWAALTLAAPWLAQPVSDVAQLIWDALGLTTVTAEDLS